MEHLVTPSRILTWTVTPAGILAVATLVACKPAPPRSEPPEPAAAAKVTPSSPSVPTIVCLGTSLTAGLGLDPDLAYPSRIQEKVDAAGLRYRVVNAGVSGETSAGALRRVDWILREPVAVLIVETGANDALRGQDPEATRTNIQALFDRARQQSPRPKLVLLGMLAPPNYGADYGRRFQALYPELAKQNGAALIPFLLEGVAGRAVLNQGDGIHPTADGQQIMAENVWKGLRPLL
jgi:acyl-CoA thioesterase-1